MLFGKAWMKLSGVSAKKVKGAKSKDMGSTMAVSFIGTLVTAYVLSALISALGGGLSEGVKVAFWIWLGFYATTMLNMVLWDGKPLNLYFIRVGHELVALLVMGAILSAWA